jgi:hypothetical protein
MNGCTVSQMAMARLKPKIAAKYQRSGQASSQSPLASPDASFTQAADRRMSVATADSLSMTMSGRASGPVSSQSAMGFP